MAAGRVVVVAVDGSVHSDNALKYYIDRVQIPGDKLLLVNVPEEYNFTDASPGVIHELLEKIKEKASEVEKTYTDRLKDISVDFQFRLVYGHPGEQIVKVAEEEKASLVMVGSRGHGWLRRTILGSVSNYVIHHTSIPVLLCKNMEPLESLNQEN
ncbi:universal stress protein in QAH/OAS sulfhydrylase 3'region-like [Mytilus edulis]|uniref:universal stress protein in QAH/OAS sulfhydrylase 3'region-like n=1 Tax=Mytilus edulis TaxID=6550 RepID=UPI0039F03757